MIKKYVLLLFYLLAGFAYTSPAAANFIEQVYRDDLHQFAIALPNQKWKWDASIRSQHVKVKIVYFSSIDQFVPNMSVSISALKESETQLSDLVKKSLTSYPKQLKVQSKKPAQHHGLEAYDIELFDETSKIIIHQRFFIHHKKVYVLTFAARKASMESVLADFKAMQNSFTLEKNTGDTL